MSPCFAPGLIRLGLALALPLGAKDPSPGSDADPVELGSGRQLGAPIVVGNLTVWPILGPEQRGLGRFLSLAEAQERGLARVNERGGDASASNRNIDANLFDAVLPNGAENLPNGAEDSRPQQIDAGLQQNFEIDGGATVGELVLVNDAELPVLVVAGTVVKGGNQDRQIAQDFVVPPRSSIPVDAFCIEQGRWTSVREGQDNGGKFVAQGFVCNKNIRTSGQYRADQEDVWFNVAAINGKGGKAPQTGTFLATAEEDDAEARELRERLRNAILEAFDARALGTRTPVLGLAYSIHGEPIGARAFASAELFEAFLPVYARTMSMEAQVAARQTRDAGEPAYDQTAPVEALGLVLSHIGDCVREHQDTPGLADLVRGANDWGGTSACVLCLDGRSVTLTEDWTTPATLSAPVRAELERLRALGYTRGDG